MRRTSTCSSVSTTTSDESDERQGIRKGSKDREQHQHQHSKESNHQHHPYQELKARQNSDTTFKSEDADVGYVGVTQVSVDVNYAELWPGIVEAKLGLYGISLSEASVLATDAMGVEIDLRTCPLPEPEQFPLKLHFKAPFCGPQNVANEEAARAVINGMQTGPMFEHSVELSLEGVLNSLVVRKLQSVGLVVGDEQRPMVLVTDCLGVVVEPSGGLPDRRRFPIKLYLDRIAMAHAEVVQNSALGSKWRPWRTSVSMGTTASAGLGADKASPTKSSSFASGGSVMSTMGGKLAAMLRRTKTVP